MARPLTAQLPAEQHHGPQVLHRDGEAQLRDEVGPPNEWLEAQTSGDDDCGGDEREDDDQ